MANIKETASNLTTEGGRKNYYDIRCFSTFNARGKAVFYSFNSFSVVHPL